MQNLGYEQLLALRIMRDSPNKEASEIAKEAGCSWNELMFLVNNRLVSNDVGRIAFFQIHPTITETGLRALELIENDGFL